jgi:predicted amidophosphoribosyltransferase
LWLVFDRILLLNIFDIISGKVLCKECVNKTVFSGPNNRAARVCDVCYTLLNKTSQPYFLAGIPQV